MTQQYMPIEKVLGIVGNRYVALNIAAQEARKVIEGINKGELQMHGSPYYESMRRLVDKEIGFEPVVPAEAEPGEAEGGK